MSIDNLCIFLDHALWSLSHTKIPVYQKKYADEVIRWMQLNHAGEVCAQSMLLGCMIMSKNNSDFLEFARMMREEYTHLELCQKKLYELGANPHHSLMLWSVGCFILAIIAGRTDKELWSLIEATEILVMRHVRESLDKCKNDEEVQTILKKIFADEYTHAITAKNKLKNKMRTHLLPYMPELFKIMKKAIIQNEIL